MTTTARIVASDRWKSPDRRRRAGLLGNLGEPASAEQAGTRAIVEALSSPFRRLWLKVRGPKASDVALEASVTATATLDARVTIQEPDDAPIERRIEIHRRRLDAIDRQLEEIRAEAAKLRTDLGDRLNAAVGEAIEQTKRLREVVDQLGVGSVGLRALGGVLVLVGSALWVVSEWL